MTEQTEQRTTERARAIVARLEDAQAVTLLKELNRTVYHDPATYGEVVEHVPRESPAAELAGLPGEVKRSTLDPAASVQATRAVLSAFAADPALAPLVIAAWEGIEGDDSLFVESVVALGLVLNLTLFLATTKARFTFANGEIEKEAGGPELVREILRPITEFVKLRGGG